MNIRLSRKTLSQLPVAAICLCAGIVQAQPAVPDPALRPEDTKAPQVRGPEAVKNTPALAPGDTKSPPARRPEDLQAPPVLAPSDGNKPPALPPDPAASRPPRP